MRTATSELPKAAQVVYLRAPNPSNKPPACQACQQRKRKCDRKQPKCSMCEKRNIECVIEARNTADLPKDFVNALEEKDDRIAALEEVIRKKIPDLAHVAALSTDAIAALTGKAIRRSSEGNNGSTGSSRVGSWERSGGHTHLDSTVLADLPSGSTGPKVQPPSSSPQRLSPALLVWVEEELSKVELGHGSGIPSTVLRHMRSQLAIEEPDPEGDGADLPPAAWPPYELAVQVVEAFFKGNSPWPIFRRVDLMRDLEAVYQGGTVLDPDATATPLLTCKLFLIFSMACAWLAHRGNGARVNTALLRNRALQCIPAMLRTEDSLSCIEALILLVLSAVHDWGGADNVQLLPIVCHLAMVVGLHEDPPAHLSQVEKDRRRLAWWGIVCLDLGVAGNLYQKPFLPPNMPVVLPSRMDPVAGLVEGLDSLFFAQITLEMWRLSVEVGNLVHQSPTEQEIKEVHRRIDEWYARANRRSNPEGSPVSSRHSPVSQAPRSASPCDSTASLSPAASRTLLFDEYYHLCVAILYRPRSPAAPPPEHLLILQNSSSEALSCIRLMGQGLLPDNYYQYNSAIGLGVTLLCTFLLFGGNEANAWDPVWCANAITEIGKTQKLIGSYCRSWPFIRGLSRAFDSLAARTIGRIMTASQDAGNRRGSAAVNGSFDQSDFHSHVLSAQMSLAANDLTGMNLSVPDVATAIQMAMPSLPANDATEEWLQDYLAPMDEYGATHATNYASSSSGGSSVSGMSNDNLDALVASLGGPQDWISAMVAGEAAPSSL